MKREFVWTYKGSQTWGNTNSVFERWKKSTHKEGTEEEKKEFYRHIFVEWAKGTIDLIVPEEEGK